MLEKNLEIMSDCESKYNLEKSYFHHDDFDENTDEESYKNNTKVHYKIFDQCDFYLNHVENFAKQQILKFFSDKELHCGGKIPHSLLENSKRVNLVINLDLDSSIKLFYEFSEQSISDEDLAKSKRTGEVSWDIIAVNDALRILSQSGVPQQFAGGMLLIYLELVKGHDINI